MATVNVNLSLHPVLMFPLAAFSHRCGAALSGCWLWTSWSTGVRPARWSTWCRSLSLSSRETLYHFCPKRYSTKAVRSAVWEMWPRWWAVRFKYCVLSPCLQLALYVLTFLAPRDLLQAAQTCRNWRTLAEDNLLWREKCREEGNDVLFSKT